MSSVVLQNNAASRRRLCNILITEVVVRRTVWAYSTLARGGRSVEVARQWSHPFCRSLRFSLSSSVVSVPYFFDLSRDQFFVLCIHNGHVMSAFSCDFPFFLSPQQAFFAVTWCHLCISLHRDRASERVGPSPSPRKIAPRYSKTAYILFIPRVRLRLALQAGKQRSPHHKALTGCPVRLGLPVRRMATLRSSS